VSRQGVKENNLKPITRVVAWASVGVDPTIMGYGPVPAIQKALKCAGLTMADMDIIEVRGFRV